MSTAKGSPYETLAYSAGKGPMNSIREAYGGTAAGSAYETLAYSAGKAPPNRVTERWFNMPGTSPYELNMNVSAPQGPAWGPKSSIFGIAHSMTKTQSTIMWSIIVILIILVIAAAVWFMQKKHHPALSVAPAGYYY